METLFRVLTGSRLYGLNVEDSDYDFCSVVAPSFSDLLYRVDSYPTESLSFLEGTESFWDVRRFLNSYLKGSFKAVEVALTLGTAYATWINESWEKFFADLFSREVLEVVLSTNKETFSKSLKGIALGNLTPNVYKRVGAKEAARAQFLSSVFSDFVAEGGRAQALKEAFFDEKIRRFARFLREDGGEYDLTALVAKLDVNTNRYLLQGELDLRPLSDFRARLENLLLETVRG